MTTQDIHEFTSLHINISLLRSLRYSVRGFKMKKVFAFLLSEVIMELGLRMLSSNHYVKGMVFFTTSLHWEHLNRMA